MSYDGRIRARRRAVEAELHAVPETGGDVGAPEVGRRDARGVPRVHGGERRQGDLEDDLRTGDDGRAREPVRGDRHPAGALRDLYPVDVDGRAKRGP
jgi:hypothetical protein